MTRKAQGKREAASEAASLAGVTGLYLHDDDRELQSHLAEDFTKALTLLRRCGGNIFYFGLSSESNWPAEGIAFQTRPSSVLRLDGRFVPRKLLGYVQDVEVLRKDMHPLNTPFLERGLITMAQDPTTNWEGLPSIVVANVNEGGGGLHTGSRADRVYAAVMRYPPGIPRLTCALLNVGPYPWNKDAVSAKVDALATPKGGFGAIRIE